MRKVIHLPLSGNFGHFGHFGTFCHFLTDLRHEADGSHGEVLNYLILFLIGLERDRKDLENRAHELQINLDEAEANAIKWGRKMVAKLESRAKDIEGKLLMNLSETMLN